MLAWVMIPIAAVWAPVLFAGFIGISVDTVFCLVVDIVLKLFATS
jgi:hypothetical protein